MCQNKEKKSKNLFKDATHSQSDEKGADVHPSQEEQFTPEQMVEVIHKSLGLITKAAKMLGCSPKTIYNYRDKYDEVRQAIDDAREATCDQAEFNIIEAITKKDIETSKWYLSRMGRHRGYGDKVDHKVDGEVKTTKVQVFKWGDQEIEF